MFELQRADRVDMGHFTQRKMVGVTMPSYEGGGGRKVEMGHTSTAASDGPAPHVYATF
jgi:hypothetical protein